jgi:hypothetical protein
MMTSNYWFGGAQAYQIAQSLRFNSADSAYLNRTPGSAGNRRTFTWSSWVKRGALSSYQNFIRAGGTLFRFSNSDTLNYEDGLGGNLSTTAVFRDPSSWYHVVLSVDTTQATSSNRLKIYVNGIEQALSGTNPSQNSDTSINNTTAHFIGQNTAGAEYLSAYLTEINFIDGQALTPSSFGETDPDTGAWIPKRYGGSYGTNGFYLKFDPAATNGIGHDHSGNGNNWTASGFTTSGTGTDVINDTPTTNWCTFNPLANAWSNSGTGSVADGNLYLSYSSGNWFGKKGTMAVSSGKWYYEWTNTSGGTSSQCGFTTIESASETGSGVYRYRSNGEKVNTSYTASYGATWSTAGDIIGIALDIDAGTIVFYKNGVSQGTAFSSIPAGTYIPECVIEGAGYTGYANFGQRAFEYTPPTGYKALNAANLPEPTIKDGGKYFNTVLYTGNGGTQAVTGVGFQPDMTWIKRRNASAEHWINDAVRGAGYSLPPSSTLAEQNYTTLFTSFDSDGFSLASGTSSFNESASTYVAWNWDAGGAGSSNNAGTITSTVSANASAGFSIATYTGNGTAGATIGHGLGVAPKMIIVKQRSGATDWQIGHQDIAWTKTLYFTTAAATTETGAWNDTAPTSTVFSVGTSRANTSSATYVAYCFSEVAGYSKFGSYTGNGSTTDGPFIWCGFTPRWILIKWYKDVSSAESWHIYDTARQTYNATNTILQPDSSGAEETPSDRYIDILSNGFKLRQNGQQINRSGASYIFAAFAELPFKYANAR